VVSSSSNSYAADNFTLRRQEDKLVGTLNSNVNAYVEFTRAN
jgi:hypothetical protein